MRWKTSWSSLAVVLAACSTGGDWSREATDQAAMEADLRACDAAARELAVVPRPRDPQGVAQPHMPDADHQLELMQRVDRCMRARGYTFEPRRRLLL